MADYLVTLLIQVSEHIRNRQLIYQYCLLLQRVISLPYKPDVNYLVI